MVVVLVFSELEWRATLAGMGDQIALQRSVLGPYLERSWTGPGGAIPGVVLHPGVGQIAAAAATQFAVQTWQPQLLAVLGTCGGICAEVAPLDLLRATRTVVYDFSSAIPRVNSAMRRARSTDLPVLADMGPLPFPVRPGVLATADGDPTVVQLAALRQDHAWAVDWESGAVAWVCARNAAPCLILRGVADDATAPAAAQRAAYTTHAPAVMARLWAVWEALAAAGGLSTGPKGTARCGEDTDHGAAPLVGASGAAGT